MNMNPVVLRQPEVVAFWSPEIVVVWKPGVIAIWKPKVVVELVIRLKQVCENGTSASC